MLLSSSFSTRRSSSSGATSSSKRAAQTVAKRQLAAISISCVRAQELTFAGSPCHTGYDGLWQRIRNCFERKFPYDNIYSLEYAYNSLTNRSSVQLYARAPRNTPLHVVIVVVYLTLRRRRGCTALPTQRVGGRRLQLRLRLRFALACLPGSQFWGLQVTRRRRRQRLHSCSHFYIHFHFPLPLSLLACCPRLHPLLHRFYYLVGILVELLA